MQIFKVSVQGFGACFGMLITYRVRGSKIQITLFHVNTYQDLNFAEVTKTPSTELSKTNPQKVPRLSKSHLF